MTRTSMALIGLCAALPLIGCGGSSGPATYPVSGTVTFNGEPVKEGRIAFRDTEGQVPSAGGEITNGKFSFQAQPATMKVSITARRKVPGKFTSPAPGIKEPLTKQYIPARYNTESELTKDVTAGENDFHFELKGPQ